MTIREMIALIMLYGNDNDWILGATASMIDCDKDEISIYPSGGPCIVISRSEYLKGEEE